MYGQSNTSSVGVCDVAQSGKGAVTATKGIGCTLSAINNFDDILIF